jgi:NitT/TauT family transport system substrate-binding protein
VVALIGGASALSLVLAGCGGGAAQSAPDKNEDGVTTLKLGILPVADVAPVYLGIEKGFFEKNGIELELQPAAAGAALVASVQSGEVPIGYSNVLSLMQAKERGLDVTTVAQGSLSMEPNKEPQDPRGQNILVSADSDIESVKDLAGKTLAVTGSGSLMELTARAAIDREGGDSDSVEYLEVESPQMSAALADGQVDAVTVNEPFASVMIAEGARAIAHPYTDLDDPASQIAVYFSQSKFIDENPELIKSFQTAMEESLTYAQDHLDEVRAIIPEFSTIPADKVEAMVLPYWTPEINESSLKEIADLAVDYGFLDSEPDLDQLLAGVK